MKTVKTVGLILGVGLGIILGIPWVLAAYFHYSLSVMKLAMRYYDYMGF